MRIVDKFFLGKITISNACTYDKRKQSSQKHNCKGRKENSCRWKGREHQGM